MIFSIETLKVTRQNMIHLVEGLTIEQLQKIPKGFNNTIFWNFAHCLVTQQLLHYFLSGNEILIDQIWIDRYRKGTQAEFLITSKEVEFVKTEMLSSVLQLQKDYDKEIFTQYQAYKTSYNVEIKNIEEALLFNNLHESLHLGYMMAMRKWV